MQPACMLHTPDSPTSTPRVFDVDPLHAGSSCMSIVKYTLQLQPIKQSALTYF